MMFSKPLKLFMDQVYNQNFIDFVLRAKDWLDRVAVGELHLPEPPMEPFLMSSAARRR